VSVRDELVDEVPGALAALRQRPRQVAQEGPAPLELPQGVERVELRATGQRRLLVGPGHSGHVVVARPEQSLLGAEVVHHQRLGDPRLLGDRAQAGAVHAVLAEQIYRGLDDPLRTATGVRSSWVGPFGRLHVR